VLTWSPELSILTPEEQVFWTTTSECSFEHSSLHAYRCISMLCCYGRWNFRLLDETLTASPLTMWFFVLDDAGTRSYVSCQDHIRSTSCALCFYFGCTSVKDCLFSLLCVGRCSVHTTLSLYAALMFHRWAMAGCGGRHENQHTLVLLTFSKASASGMYVLEVT
jgi:hypothetical protein